MNKKLKFAFISTLLAIGIFFLFFNKKNKIVVYAKNFEKEKVIIKYCYDEDLKDFRNAVKSDFKIILYKNGSQQKNFDIFSGDNYFLVEYENKYVIVADRVEHDFKTGLAEPTTYNFQLEKNNNEIYLEYFLGTDNKNAYIIKKIKLNN